MPTRGATACGQPANMFSSVRPSCTIMTICCIGFTVPRCTTSRRTVKSGKARPSLFAEQAEPTIVNPRAQALNRTTSRTTRILDLLIWRFVCAFLLRSGKLGAASQESSLTQESRTRGLFLLEGEMKPLVGVLTWRFALLSGERARATIRLARHDSTSIWGLSYRRCRACSFSRIRKRDSRPNRPLRPLPHPRRRRH
jgi:hypothetical protein